jgi:hypothetical protein
MQDRGAPRDVSRRPSGRCGNGKHHRSLRKSTKPDFPSATSPCIRSPPAALVQPNAVVAKRGTPAQIALAWRQAKKHWTFQSPTPPSSITHDDRLIGCRRRADHQRNPIGRKSHLMNISFAKRRPIARMFLCIPSIRRRNATIDCDGLGRTIVNHCNILVIVLGLDGTSGMFIAGSERTSREIPIDQPVTPQWKSQNDSG